MQELQFQVHLAEGAPKRAGQAKFWHLHQTRVLHLSLDTQDQPLLLVPLHHGPQWLGGFGVLLHPHRPPTRDDL